MGENGRRQACRRRVQLGRLTCPFLLGSLLLLAGCGTWHRFVPAEAPDSEQVVRLSCLEDSVSIVITRPANDPYEAGSSEQFHCDIEIRSLASAAVVVQVPQLDLVVGDISYPMDQRVFDGEAREFLSAYLSEERVTLPREEPTNLPYDPRHGMIQCRADGVKHEGATSALLTGRLLITASDGRRAELPVRIPLVKISERRPHRWWR